MYPIHQTDQSIRRSLLAVSIHFKVMFTLYSSPSENSGFGSCWLGGVLVTGSHGRHGLGSILTGVNLYMILLLHSNLENEILKLKLKTPFAPKLNHV